MTEIIEVTSKKQLKQFIDFPNILYKDDKNYVPPLFLSVDWMLGRKNPFLRHSQIALFLAINDGKIKGRIAAICNQTHLDTYNDRTGFFGFFDTENDQEVADKLFNSASAWLSSKRITGMIGPANLTTNDSCGILTDGFNEPPMVLMPYNYSYYENLLKNAGFQKATDLYSYHVQVETILSKYLNVYDNSLKKLAENGIRIRQVSAASFDEDMKQLRLVYNSCNAENWGFIPLNPDEFRAMAKDLKTIAPLDFALVAEKENKILGFIIAVPNLNEALKHVKNGRLFPFGIFKLLWYKRKIATARVLILGVQKEYSGQGIDLVLYHKITEAVKKRGIQNAEACYVMENNVQMNSILKKLDGKCAKTYRIYRKEL
jgi:GNAT superfamily N-acetyltransferase